MAERCRADLLSGLEQRLRAEDEHPLPKPLAAGLTFLAGIYRLLYLLDRLPYLAGMRRPIHPGVPVISLGNLAVGGTGKTPCVIWLANALQRAGIAPVVLAHSYRGGSEPRLLSPGENAAGLGRAGVGDEARLISLSCPGVPVVAGRDRVAAARLAIEACRPRVLLADDAFQHWRLARDLDLVLLDAARPFGNGRLLPRGWLREPPRELRRAGALIRMGRGGELAGLPAKPVFTADVRPTAFTRWDDWARGARGPLPAGPGSIAAFCGLARPERFYATLADLGWNVVARLSSPDHMLPDPSALGRWARAAGEAVVTTEKDAVKLTAAHRGAIAASGRELYVLSVAFFPEKPDELLDFVLARIGRAR